jgi:phage baseplate assembly protein gpV
MEARGEEKVITYQELQLANYDIVYMKAFKMVQTINDHAHMELVALLDQETKEKMIEDQTEAVEVCFFEKDEKTVLFTGLITSFELQTDGELYELKLEAKSASFCMDLVKQSRSFQNLQMTSWELVKEVMKNYSRGDCSLQIPNMPIGELVIQYEETDWEFLRRFVSRYNQGLYPEPTHLAAKYYAGIPDLSIDLTVENLPFTLSKNVQHYSYQKQNYLPTLQEIHYTCYLIKTYSLLPLGGRILHEGHSFYVSHLERFLEKGELVTKYTLQLKEGLNQKRLYNKKAVGVSINGSILEVKRSQVKVHLEIDKEQNQSKAYWFPYSTVSASEDGSGWYCMPEIGEQVRIYIPTGDEAKALAITNIQAHKPETVEETDKMGNPNVKRLHTAQDKEIRFNEDGVLIQANGGAASIELKKDGSIVLQADKDLSITAVEKVSLRAEETIDITADKTIDLLCEKEGNVLFTPAGLIHFKAKEIEEN